ncbi:hypothetical protein BdWA1_001509 [Babesia duncani]|uniref:Uncharacterized protein n=1 Tax=Babesia duncani TaxID=323732 RepID=A0AAD9PK04_9APIC|nr:hypothetical protein BdWA1_001509 [Babesia duncani]
MKLRWLLPLVAYCVSDVSGTLALFGYIGSHKRFIDNFRSRVLKFLKLGPETSEDFDLSVVPQVLQLLQHISDCHKKISHISKEIVADWEKRAELNTLEQKNGQLDESQQKELKELNEKLSKTLAKVINIEEEKWELKDRALKMIKKMNLKKDDQDIKEILESSALISDFINFVEGIKG